MGQVFTSFFAFVITLFSAAERVASAGNHLATWADEAAGQFEDEARHNRQVKRDAFLKEAGITELPKANAKKIAAPKVA